MPRIAVRIVLFALPLTLFAAIVATWFLFKPIRALFPEFAGLQCNQTGVCVDDTSRFAEAAQLKSEAVRSIEQRLGQFEHVPPILFCTTTSCEKWFGFKGNVAYNVGAIGLVVAARGWQPHFIRHELIHHVQVEKIGGFRMWLITPTWFIEGMAYSLSDDPRRPLQQPWEGYRTQYEEWVADIPMGDLWARAKAL
jgi:hypothetical protein